MAAADRGGWMGCRRPVDCGGGEGEDDGGCWACLFGCRDKGAVALVWREKAVKKLARKKELPRWVGMVEGVEAGIFWVCGCEARVMVGLVVVM